jgi:(p)ppGpp synthase/HD superfamily hydrolase
MARAGMASNDKGWVLALSAAERAAKWHAEHRHKGVTQVPFVNHLIEVALLVTTATDGNDPVLTTAAFLHDAAEKAGIPPSQIRSEFGDAVYELVMEVTDDKTLSRDDRRQRQIETAASKSMKAKMIMLADKTSNLRALAEYAPMGAAEENPLEYAEWVEKVANGLRGVSPWLEQQFEHALSAVRIKIAQFNADRPASLRR